MWWVGWEGWAVWEGWEGPQMSEIWHALIAAGDFPDEGKLATKIAGWHVLLVRADVGFVAVNDRCTHQAALLSAGKIRRGAVMCPLHGARFDVTSGQCLGGAYAALRVFAVRETDGMIEVAVPDRAPRIDEVPISL